MDLSFVAVLALPVLMIVGAAFYEQWVEYAWEREAIRLGLEPSGSSHALALNGSWRGTRVHVVHNVTYGYKRDPSFTHVIRACLATDAAVAGATIEGHAIVDGWLERHGTGRIRAGSLERSLDSIVSLVEAVNRERG